MRALWAFLCLNYPRPSPSTKLQSILEILPIDSNVIEVPYGHLSVLLGVRFFRLTEERRA